MENIEYGAFRRKENPAQRFLQRIQDAEKRGLQIKPGQSINERTLSQFERTGVQVTSGYLSPANEMTESEYKRLREKIFSGYDRNERLDKWREDYRAKLENEMKIQKLGLCILAPEPETKYIYL